MSTIIAKNVVTASDVAFFDWELIETQVASSSADIAVINLTSKYSTYKFIWSDVAPASDLVDFWMTVSTNNGSTWDAGGSDYAWSRRYVTMAASPVESVLGDNLDGVIQVLDGCGNAVNISSSLEITCFDPSASAYTNFKWEGIRGADTDLWRSITGAGVRLTTTPVNGVRFLYDTGGAGDDEIESGTLKVYGIRGG